MRIRNNKRDRNYTAGANGRALRLNSGLLLKPNISYIKLSWLLHLISGYDIEIQQIFEFGTVSAGGESLGWITLGCPVLQGELIGLEFVTCLRPLILILLDYGA